MVVKIYRRFDYAGRPYVVNVYDDGTEVYHLPTGIAIIDRHSQLHFDSKRLSAAALAEKHIAVQIDQNLERMQPDFLERIIAAAFE